MFSRARRRHPAGGPDPPGPAAVAGGQDAELAVDRVGQGKAVPPEGPPVDLGALVYPQLTPQRERLLRKFNRLADAPAGPAAEVYAGVLYQHLGLADLPGDRVLIASALWGVLRPGDRIPHYKLPMNAKVPRVITRSLPRRES